MNASQQTRLSEEIYDLFSTHLAELTQYGIRIDSRSHVNLNNVIDDLEQLLAYTRLNPDQIEPDCIDQIAIQKKTIDRFLRIISADYVVSDITSELGKVYQRINLWCDIALSYNETTCEQIWNILAPAQPDTLEDLGQNQFEACWRIPVPKMDIEIVKRTPNIEILQGPFSPKRNPSIVALRFQVN